MADITSQDMATKLLAAGFERSSPSTSALSDPIADTPMVVTLDQLRPYDHDPRMKRNSAYDEIKASIRERGLDASPAITRRPGAEHYIIRNGGNTRLAILRELWSETKDERFFRISCLFRPWPERGEIIALTGHLAENELRGGLTFIERALGVEKAREFYEQESGAALNQSELARRLAADGYPVQQSHISRMSDAVRYLLPAIPTVLYAGLGRHQIERLAVMRKSCERIWEHRAKGKRVSLNFESFFQDVLTQFDTQVEEFSWQRVQDELIGQMSDLLDVDYDVLSLDLNDSDRRQRALVTEPTPMESPAPLPVLSAAPSSVVETPSTASAPLSAPPVSPPAVSSPAPEAIVGANDANTERLLEHIISTAPTTERLQSIQRMVADQLGDAIPPEFSANVLQSIPVQAGGLYPISDVWYIDPGLDSPDRLRTHIEQFAREIADEAGVADCVQASSDGIGFRCAEWQESLPVAARAVMHLLRALSGQPIAVPEPDDERLAVHLPVLLHGNGQQAPGLSDTALVKLFRLLRLARRLVELGLDRPHHGA